jgi:hypothetical protein
VEPTVKHIPVNRTDITHIRRPSRNCQRLERANLTAVPLKLLIPRIAARLHSDNDSFG